jgi:hypothetical protein
MIRKLTEHLSAQRPHQEAAGEYHRGVELLYDWIDVWKERAREKKREGGISVEVVPLNEIAD